MKFMRERRRSMQYDGSSVMAVFETIARSGEISRAEISRLTGFSQVTVGRAVELFDACGIITQYKAERASAGRKTGICRLERSFAMLSDYVAKNHPDMRLFLGHELGYHHGCITALENGKCRTVAGSRYVLVDFPEKVNFFELSNAMKQLRSMGFQPILAHAERYRCLSSKFDWIRSFVEDGGVVQINASSGQGSWGLMAKMQWKKLLRMGHFMLLFLEFDRLTTSFSSGQSFLKKARIYIQTCSFLISNLSFLINFRNIFKFL